MHYYKRHLGDYAKKAGHLSPLEHGVYTLILDSYYDREQAPTLIEATRWARARTEEEKAAVLAVLDEFFTLADDRYSQKRVEEELGEYRDKAETNRVIAVAREQRKRERRENDTTKVVAPEEHEPCTTGQPNQEPRTINQEPVKSKASASGSRLPQDWRPNEDDVDYFRKNCQTKKISDVAANFYDYWIAKPGAAGRKLDWSATWRTWVRREAGDVGPGKPQGGTADWLKGAI